VEDHVADLRQLILDLALEVRELRRDRDAPVRGLREAAAALRVSRSQISSKIEELPPERRPLTLGEKHTVWWRSRAALLDWWEDAHSVERYTPPEPTKSRKKPKPTRPKKRRATVSPQQPTSLADRLRALRDATDP